MKWAYVSTGLQLTAIGAYSIQSLLGECRVLIHIHMHQRNMSSEITCRKRRLVTGIYVNDSPGMATFVRWLAKFVCVPRVSISSRNKLKARTIYVSYIT